MRRRIGITIVCLLFVAVLSNASAPTYLAYGQTGEPRFSYPGARRFAINSYFDHHAPGYTVDHNLTIYTTEVGLDTNGSPHCYTSGGITVCGYYTEPNSGGRRIYYYGHPAIDYAFPQNTPVSAAASGTAYQRIVGEAQAVAINHGGNYWTKYLHVDGGSRIADGSVVTRGLQIALSSDTGTAPGAYHLHFEARYNGENGPVVDPYGWWGQWYTDPWNQPFGHTQPWWRSGDPIPMGYRNQNNATQGPYQLSGIMQDKWELQNGLPGSPVGNRGSNNCPGNSGDCQFFERGYLRWDYSNTLYYPYAETVVSQVFYIAQANWNTTLSIRNTSGTTAQVSVIFMTGGRTVDSRTYVSLLAGSTWALSSQQALQDMTDSFAGEAYVYSSQAVQVTVAHQPALGDAFLPAILNNY